MNPPDRTTPAEHEPAPARNAAIDALRGVAVLGILVMNILSFALPESCYIDPTILLPADSGMGGSSEALMPARTPADAALRPATFWPWLLSTALFDMKFIAIFSMLFGAGVVLFERRRSASAIGLSPAHSPGFAWLRRCLVLLAIGVLHGIFVWDGDILHAYALCGLLAWPARRLRTPWLWTLGIAGVFIAALLLAGMLWMGAHEDPSRSRPPMSSLEHEISVYRGSYPAILAYRSTQFMWGVIWSLPLYTFWRAGGLMLIGIALARAGVFSVSTSARALNRMMLIGYSIGVPLTVAGIAVSISTGFDEIAHHVVGMRVVELASLPMALGHIALVLRLVRASQVGAWLAAWLAPVGRTALSNYLFQSIVCTAIFHGWGFARFAHLNRLELLGVVIAVWITQVLLTRLWLSRFAMGPAEWAWRRMAGNVPTSSSTASSPVADGGGVIESAGRDDGGGG